MPLYLRILLLFLLNVALLFGALAWAAHRQMQSGLDSFLGAMVAANLQKAASGMSLELTDAPAEKWPEVLARFEQKHKVQAGLFRDPADYLAGSVKDLPPEVLIGLFRGLGSNSRRPGMGPPGGPPGGPGRMDRPNRPEDAGVPARRTPAGAPGGGRDIPKALVRTGVPSRYWAVASLLPIDTGERGPPSRLTFAIVTDSVLTCPLLFDTRPWLLGFGGTLLFSCLLWLPFVRGITAKLREMRKATGQMATGRLNTRIRENRRDEIGQLAASVNLMAGQLEGYVNGQRRFTRDIAHELCSPISRMQAAVGVLDTGTLDPRQRQYVDALNDELQHMSHLVQELLQFAKTAHSQEHQLTEVVLDPLIQTVIDRECSMEGAPPLTVNVPNDLIVTAEPLLLSRALGNILRNALRYAASGGPVEITAAASGGGKVQIAIADHGPGVPDDSLPRLFDPFYRPDEARSPGEGGAGLGLAIVKFCVEACEGTVTAANRQPHGLCVTVELLAAA